MSTIKANVLSTKVDGDWPKDFYDPKKVKCTDRKLRMSGDSSQGALMEHFLTALFTIFSLSHRSMVILVVATTILPLTSIGVMGMLDAVGGSTSSDLYHGESAVTAIADDHCDIVAPISYYDMSMQPIGQTFIPTRTNIVSFSIYIDSSTFNDIPMTANILAGGMGGAIVGSATTFVVPGHSHGWLSVSFDQAIPLTADETYALDLIENSPTPNAVYWYLCSSAYSLRFGYVNNFMLNMSFAFIESAGIISTSTTTSTSIRTSFSTMTQPITSTETQSSISTIATTVTKAELSLVQAAIFGSAGAGIGGAAVATYALARSAFMPRPPSKPDLLRRLAKFDVEVRSGVEREESG